MKNLYKTMIFICMLSTSTMAQDTKNIVVTAPEDSAKATTPQSDDAISINIRSKISDDALLAGANILVITKVGVVTLSGTAISQAQIDEAVKVAKTETGVTSVKSSISVQTPAVTTTSEPST